MVARSVGVRDLNALGGGGFGCNAIPGGEARGRDHQAPSSLPLASPPRGPPLHSSTSCPHSSRPSVKGVEAMSWFVG